MRGGVVLDTRGSRRKLYVADELNRAIRVISYERRPPTQTPVTLVPSTTGMPTSAPSKRQDAFRLPYSLIRTH